MKMSARGRTREREWGDRKLDVQSKRRGPFKVEPQRSESQEGKHDLVGCYPAELRTSVTTSTPLNLFFLDPLHLRRWFVL